MSITNTTDISAFCQKVLRYVGQGDVAAVQAIFENIAASIATNAEGVAATAAAAAIAAVNPRKIYLALVTQSSTSAPTASILGSNTIGTIVWARTSAGVYTATLSGAFAASKTVVSIKSQAVNDDVSIDVVMTSTNVITITTNLITNPSGTQVVTPTDGLMTALPIEITVYP